MCHCTNINYSCKHWGGRKITLPCQWAKKNAKTGCYNVKPPEGVVHLDYMCDSCKFRENLGSTSPFTHVGIDGIRRPLTRDSIAESKPEGTIEKLKEAEAKSAKEEAEKIRKEIQRNNLEKIRKQDADERREDLLKNVQELDEWFDAILEEQRRIYKIKKGELQELYAAFGDNLGII
ncbi:778455e6-6dd2-4ec0-be79-647fd54d55c8 [Sclerotinia trifoliorum]|uniref:778455e6-6dd2-4ec0-be79-647fd54d55c8 n=1 Tax=Sclerotinia trifoliorum TaxID=28548 RepID=A0A8H2VM30_9HELO|nr:778455e6-6dd2-4ec0-be79-647fd54d55c8 [Sclerotinia trifoliorum]